MTEQVSGAHLKTLREVSGLTAEKAAARCGVSRRTWFYWEEAPLGDRIDLCAVARVEGFVEAQFGLLASPADPPETVQIVRCRDADDLLTHEPHTPSLEVHAAMLRAHVIRAVFEGKKPVVLWHGEEAGA